MPQFELNSASLRVLVVAPPRLFTFSLLPLPRRHIQNNTAALPIMGSDVDSTVPESFTSQGSDHKDASRRAFEEVNGIQKLPQELWDIAVAYLSDHEKSLKFCGLTCKALRQSSRKLFWRRLHLLESARVESLLSDHPDVAAFVQKLSVSLPLAKLPLLLEFKNLKSLTWSQEHKWDADEDEEDNSNIPGNIPPFPRDLSFPGVTDLTVVWYNNLQNVLFLHLVACFPSVSSLRVDGGMNGIDERDVGLQKKELQLQNIPLSLPFLEGLEFKCTSLAPALPRILHATGDSLKRIELMFLKDFGEATAELLDLSAVTRLTRLEVYLGFSPLYEDWGDSLAALLSHINNSHRSLTHIFLHVPSLLPDRETGLQRTWNAPGERLGQELSRVMDEVPDVVVIFHQRRTMSHWAAKHAHGTLGQSLQNDFPHLATFPKRLRFAWDIKVWEWEDGPSRMHNEALIQEWQI
ncbi:hypothetical protein FOMPIDRAFT_84382 [Fomitopsis schrenkii]|uniref:F-box domain-containing protein n=1 Tax=Fomitopsis schrenkii TaxID=2126942 RepID=S8FGG9_FOMSC|nr:hypothetical protein FOMPIDRAFT_84382 [Fomitopsis schrenkii]